VSGPPCFSYFCQTHRRLAHAAHACRLTQPAAEAFAARCTSVDRAYVANFGEEVVRSQPVFMLR